MTTKIESAFCEPDESFERPLRPEKFQDFQGQEAICERMGVATEAARLRAESLSHCLLCGPPGLGKTTLANILAKEMEAQITITSGPVLEKAGELAGLLTNLKKGDVLFIDEIHRLPRVIEEYLYSAMEDFTLDLVIDSGPAARSVQLKLEKFTLVGATTRTGSLSAPLRSRFPLLFRLDYYDKETLTGIIRRSGEILGLRLDKPSALEIASRARGTPRIANNLLRWVRDYVQIKTKGEVNPEICQRALEMLAIDKRGLDELDKKLLRVIIEHHKGGPVGITTLAAAIGEERTTIEDVIEPYLIQEGFLRRTPRGREATEQAYLHLKKLFEGVEDS